MRIDYGNLMGFSKISLILIGLLFTLSLYGILIQFSAGGGNFFIYSFSHLMKLVFGFIAMFIVSKIPARLIFNYTTLFYIVSVILLISLQPSELMKIGLILMLSKEFNKLSVSQIGKFKYYIKSFVYTSLPVFLVMIQPDLGTSLILVAIGIVLVFLARLPIKFFIIAFSIILVLIPIFWMNLYDYQKQRILTFLDPSLDPLGSGYHIIQSKIAIGSGGFFGKGFLSGTQGQLDFLPEKHTDFIFTLLSEELGFLGALLLIALYIAIIFVALIMSIKCDDYFGKYVIVAFITTFSIYCIVNIGMVSGLLPVVGIPLPLISYGGTSSISLLIGFGLVLNFANSKNNL
jgi:rod shape determining protein RodA